MNFIFSSKFAGLANFAAIVYLYLFANIADAAPIKSVPKKQNIIFMVSDGMGTSSVGLARQFNQIENNLPLPASLFMDDYLIGTLKTSSNSSYITDSAAAGTALATGQKSYNKAINVNPDKEAIGSIGEALKIQGYTIGLVVTTRVTDATPAVWYAHSESRAYEDLIAEQLVGEHPLGRVPDLVLGGGRSYFYPNTTTGGARADSRNLIDEVIKNGTWSYAGNRKDFDALDGGNNVTLPLLGLFSDTDIPYKIDRNESVYPSLNEQVQVALTALTEATKDNDQGFFLMIESSRIDHAGHDNDAAANARETVEFDTVWTDIVDYVDSADVDTIVVSVSDHETGGISLNGASVEDYQPLLDVKHSGEYLNNQILKFNNKDDDSLFTQFIEKEIFQNGLGLTNYTKEEVDRVKKVKDTPKPAYNAVLNNLTSSRAKVGFSSNDHTAVDINVYSYSNNNGFTYKVLDRESGLAGNHDNTEYSSFIETLVPDLDLEGVTELIDGIRTK